MSDDTARLPPVDPSYLIVEDDPETLHSYARGLLVHLRNIDNSGPKNGYSKETIKAAAVWLIGAYADAAVAPCTEAAELIAKLIRPKADSSSLSITKQDAYWKAIVFEAGYDPDPEGEQPSAASTYAVAKHVVSLLDASGLDSAKATIKVWRKSIHYKDNVALFRKNKRPQWQG